MNGTWHLFPGQGAQFPGMGRELAGRFASSGGIFRRADELLGFPISRLCFEGPEEELAKTAVSQPAIFLVSIATIAAIREAAPGFPSPGGAVGLSLGEYSALCAAGGISFDDALRLVRRRGELMQEAAEANPGTMASVLGLDREAVERICEDSRDAGIVRAANFNSPGQIVISGQIPAVERACALAKERGAKRTVRLKVSGAFHSPLMEPAALALAEELEKIEIREPEFPVVANATAQPVGGAAGIRKSLVRQLTNPVLFEDCIRRAAALGARSFVEIGPGQVLSGLVKRIDPAARTAAAGTPGEIETLLSVEAR